MCVLLFGPVVGVVLSLLYRQGCSGNVFKPPAVRRFVCGCVVVVLTSAVPVVVAFSAASNPFVVVPVAGSDEAQTKLLGLRHAGPAPFCTFFGPAVHLEPQNLELV